MNHDWNTVWSDNSGALYQCRRCEVSQQVMFVGMDIHPVGNPPDELCRPMDVLKVTLDREKDALKKIVGGTPNEA